jgi:two-component system, cell cycle sensor histidine kinase and response regulator CckA
MTASFRERLSMREKGLRYHLLIVEFLIVVIPSLILFYISYRENFFITPPQLMLMALTLVLILAGLLILRQIFDRFTLLAESLKKAEGGEKALADLHQDTAELHEITGSFNKLIARLEETTGDLHQRLFELLALKELTDATSRSPDAESLLGLLLEKAMAVSQAQIGSVLAVEFDANRFRVVTSKGLDPELAKDSYIDINNTLLQYPVSERKPLLVEDIENDPRTSKENDPRYGAPSFLSMPICVREELIGVLNLARKDTGQLFTSHDEHILSIMIGEIGFALENSKLHSQVLEHVKDLEDRTVELTKMNEQLQREINEKERVQGELSDTNKFLTNILDSSLSISIISTDLEQNILFWNKGAEKIFGYTAEEIVGKHKISILYPNDGVKQEVDEIRALIAKEKGIVQKELREITMEGRTLWVNLSLTPRFDERGTVIGILGIGEDITERKRAEEEQRRLEAQLHYAQKMEALGTLAGGIAHNFNNLLMGILGNTTLVLLETETGSPRYEKLKKIEKLVESGALLTKQLLGYVREGRYEIKPIDMNRVVKETSDTFAMTKKNITVHQELSEKLSTVKADQGQIEQVLWNLYVNAADAMPTGGSLFLGTEKVTHDEMTGSPYDVRPGNYVLVTVRDTGVGMDEKTMDRIFEPFFTTKRLGKGTGLGLSSVYGMVKAHGGYIEVESKQGEGTTFNLYLPASHEEIKEEKVLEGEMRGGTETILLVDDEGQILDVSEEMLMVLGYTVHTAPSGKKAIELYREHKDTIDMVILDMIMPDLSGGETYDQLKQINPHVRVLLSSGYSRDSQASEIGGRGGNGFIQKPFDMKDLARKIRDMLDKKFQ